MDFKIFTLRNSIKKCLICSAHCRVVKEETFDVNTI